MSKEERDVLEEEIRKIDECVMKKNWHTRYEQESYRYPRR